MTDTIERTATLQPRQTGPAARRPLRILATGDAATMATAMMIPGGVVDTVERAGGVAEVTRSDDVVVDALRVVPTPRYARPASED